MNLKLEQTGSRAIVYDADRIKQPAPRMFDEAYWREQGAIEGTAEGRGNALILKTPFGEVVMRSYLRGGWARRFSRDRYLFTGFGRSRPLREARMLAEMSASNLPVPHPVAAQCQRRGFMYTGVLITGLIHQTRTLAEAVSEGVSGAGLSARYWPEIGRCIRRFHDAGVVHPDLNARNILLGSDGSEIHLIDFDRAYFRRDAVQSFRSNLDRLHRSLTKFWPSSPADDLETCWAGLMSGYREVR